MEEKKELKVSLGTVVSIFIILVLIVALVGMYFYYNNELDSNNEKEIDKSTELNNNIVEKQPLENSNNNQDSEDYETTEENIVSKHTFTPLSMYTANKKVVDENREGYYISKDKYDVSLSIREGKVYFTSFLNNELYSILGINENDIKVSEKREAEVTGFTKKVVDAEICCWQTIETMYFVFLMEDGTLEYSSAKNMITNLTTEGKVENVSNIQRIHECAVGLKNDMGSINTVIALDYENNMYDIGYILYK